MFGNCKIVVKKLTDQGLERRFKSRFCSLEDPSWCLAPTSGSSLLSFQLQGIRHPIWPLRALHAHTETHTYLINKLSKIIKSFLRKPNNHGGSRGGDVPHLSHPRPRKDFSYVKDWWSNETLVRLLEERESGEDDRMLQERKLLCSLHNSKSKKEAEMHQAKNNSAWKKIPEKEPKINSKLKENQL